MAEITHNPAHDPVSPVPFRERLTCTIAEAACATGLGRTKLYELLDAGRLEAVKLDEGQYGRRLVRVRSLLRLLGEEGHP